MNLDGAARLAKWLQDNGNDGLVVAGTTGEAPVLTDAERLSLFEAVIGAVTIPVIAGTGTNDTLHSIHMTKEASKLGAAGILAVTPYYNRPSQAGIEAHMRAVCESNRTASGVVRHSCAHGSQDFNCVVAEACTRSEERGCGERCCR